MSKVLIIQLETHQEIRKDVSDKDFRSILSEYFSNPNNTVKYVIFGGEIIWFKDPGVK
jgi:hypothetical protein